MSRRRPEIKLATLDPDKLDTGLIDCASSCTTADNIDLPGENFRGARRPPMSLNFLGSPCWLVRIERRHRTTSPHRLVVRLVPSLRDLLAGAGRRFRLLSWRSAPRASRQNWPLLHTE